MYGKLQLCQMLVLKHVDTFLKLELLNTRIPKVDLGNEEEGILFCCLNFDAAFYSKHRQHYTKDRKYLNGTAVGQAAG